MKRHVTVSLLCSVLACVVLLLIAVGVGAQGQDGGAAQSIGPAMLTGTPISSTFSYQGQLKSGGSAVSGPCDFQFGLWDAASTGTQVGVTQTLSAVNVVNGLFTVQINFGANVFNGDTRLLSIAVRCPAGSGSYAPLDPRQSITPAPYAAYAAGNWGLTGNRGTGANNFLGTTDNTTLTLGVSNTTALRLIPNANAPILIGGYAGNAVNGVADGSIIAGGGSVVYGANIISGTNVGWSTISGGFNNQISGAAVNTVIGGGYANQISGYNTDHSSIGGGWINHIDGGAYDSTIGNGDSNEISGNADHSVVGSGWINQISGTASYSAIGSGESNQINGGADHSAIGSGYENQISGTASSSAIDGGESNQITENADHSAIGSGYQNQISGTANHSAIAGGQSNQIGGSAFNSAIGGGGSNRINGAAAGGVIGGGSDNHITNGSSGTIGGGANNQISGSSGANTIGGGVSNQISGLAGFSAIGGGNGNQIGGDAFESAIDSGYQNQITGTAYDSTIGSGDSNLISGGANGSAIGSGSQNQIGGTADYSAIGSGYSNQITGTANHSAIGGGNTNRIIGTANTSVIGGGLTNKIGGNAYNSTISGGNTNQINGNAGNAAIGGGASNVISGTNTAQSTIGGGGFNTISGSFATIPGGYYNIATGDYSFASGTQARANHTGAFVWGDNTLVDFASTGNNQFLIRAGGGMGVGTNAPAAQLHVSSSGGGVTPQLRLDQTNLNDYVRLRMVVGSDTSKGWDVAAISTTFTFYSGSVEKNVLTMTPSDPTDYMTMGNNAHLTAGGAWTNASDRNVKANFTPVDGRAVLDKVLSLPISTWNYKAEDAATRHLGPMAQDFRAAFGLGSDDKSIGTVDEEGVALAAIQGLYQVVAEKDQRITQLENEVAQLKNAAPVPDQPFNPFNLISPLLSVIALGGVIAIGLRQKRGGTR